jgi:hypothetical protein
MKRTLIISSMAFGFLALAAGLVFATSGGTPQASITLTNADSQFCYTHDNNWTLDKTVTSNTVDPTTGMGTVTWTVTATKDSSGAATFTVQGGLTVTNTGTAPATIGNIVVNLQKPNSPKKGSNASYVSVAADVADATNGDGATSANIVAAGSQENVATNAAWGTNNYTVSGARGTFSETPGKSGALSFTDASDNSVFSLVPQLSLAPNQSITLLYSASFSTSILSAGTAYRVEALVSFGNAGGRGGSGATGSSIDINGNGVVDTDELHVRTVPSRVTLPALGSPSECNDSVALTDTGASATGTVTTSNPIGFDQLPPTINASGSWDVSVDVNGGTDGGTVCNSASLAGTACGGTLNVVDPNTGQFATYQCAAAAAADASACVDIGAHQSSNFCSYTQGAFNSSSNSPVATYLQNNFSTLLFPSGLTIGTTPSFYAQWTDVNKFRTWIGGGGPSGALTANTVNATSTSGGTLAKQAGALTVNLALSGVYPGDPAGLGNLTLCNLVEGSVIGSGDSTWTLTAAQAAALNGQTISQVLAAANTALGTGVLPYNIASFGDLNQLLTALNESFDDCTISGFGAAYLCP